MAWRRLHGLAAAAVASPIDAGCCLKRPRLLRPRSVAASTSRFSRRYSSQYAPTTVGQLLRGEGAVPAAGDVAVNGVVRSVRSMKSAAFVTLWDGGSSSSTLQAIVPVDQTQGLSVGAAVCLKGAWVESPGRGQSHELQVRELQVVGPSDASTYPIQKKYHSLEFLRTVPHLRPRIPYNAALLRLRSEVIRDLQSFFDTRNYIQTHPPLITSSDCEGAGEVFEVTPAASEVGAQDSTTPESSFFRSPSYLTVSSQLHLEALAQSVGNVWTLSPTFRAEKSDTSRHLSEFYMLEAEMAFVDNLGGIMDLVEDMVRHIAQGHARSHFDQEMAPHLSSSGEADFASREVVERRWEGLAAPNWPRITYDEAVDLLMDDAEELAETPPQWGDGLSSEQEKYIAAVVGQGRPVFVTNYPRIIKPFYMRPSPGARDEGITTDYPGSTVECFDLLVPELCEIAGGSMREHRLHHLVAAMKAHGLPAPNFESNEPDRASGGKDGADGSVPPTAQPGALDWYVDLRRWGCPPHGGFGLGFDRLLAYLSGVHSVRDVVACPRWYGRCNC